MNSALSAVLLLSLAAVCSGALEFTDGGMDSWENLYKMPSKNSQVGN